METNCATGDTPPKLRRRGALAVLAGASLGAALPWARPARATALDRPTALDPALLDRAARRAAGMDQLNSLIVARGGQIGFGEAFRGPPLDRPVNVKSVSKTIVAALTGAALDRGVLRGVDQPVAELLADLVPADADPRVGDITIAHLLSMQAGLERTSGIHYGSWVSSRNWIAYALGRPFVTEPGERMLYSTGSYHLLGAALARATGRTLLALARDWLGAPLGIDIPAWIRDPQGFYLGGNEMALSPLALLRFGEMVRLGGVWDGTRVLSTGWIEDSWTPRTRSVFSGDDYGFGWFLTQSSRRAGGTPAAGGSAADTPAAGTPAAGTADGGHGIAYARGYGGQMVYVVPSLSLTVVVTSDPTRPARSRGYVGELRAMLTEDIIPAAERA